MQVSDNEKVHYRQTYGGILVSILRNLKLGVDGRTNKLLGVWKNFTGSYHPDGNGGVDRVDYTMARMLAMVNELQNNWDEQPPHVEFVYNDSVSAATGLTPNEVQMGRLPRLPLTVFERAGVACH